MTSIFPTLEEIELSEAGRVISRQSRGIERKQRLRCETWYGFPVYTVELNGRVAVKVQLLLTST
jgi:hypothetical protein